jgi:hypothetical protein
VRLGPGWGQRRLAGALLLLLAGLATAVALSGTVAAGMPRWAALGVPKLPSADHSVVWQVAADPVQPSSLIAATSRGVFTSVDGGQQWQSSSITSWSWTVTFAPHGTAAYVGTDRHGVYRTTDNGATFTAENDGLANLDVRAITASANAVILGTNSGVYVSGTGEGWAPAGLQHTSISSVAVISDSPLSVLAGSDSTISKPNLFENLAAASSKEWESVASGDPGGSPVFAVAAGPLAAGASSPPILVGSLKGLMLSTNNASTWQQVNLSQGVLWSANAIAFDPENPTVVYVGGDNGGSTGGGLQRSLDGGTSWGIWQGSLPASGVTGLWVEPTSPVTVLAALWNGATREPATAKLVDTSAPGAVKLQQLGSTPIPVSPPPTSPATPKPSHHRAHPLRLKFSLPAWAPPILAAAVVVLLVGLVMALRRRRTRLDAEAPP